MYKSITLNGGVTLGQNKLGPGKGERMSIWTGQTIQRISLPIFCCSHTCTESLSIAEPRDPSDAMGSLHEVTVTCRVISALDSPSLRRVTEGDTLCCEAGCAKSVNSFWPARSMSTVTEICLEKHRPVKYPAVVPWDTAEGWAGGLHWLGLGFAVL